MPERGPHAWLQRSWYGGRRVAWLLPAALLFGAVSAMRRAAYRRGWLTSHHAGVPTVVVGNLTVGGTGKTPLVIWLATQLQQRQVRVGVVLRGYGGRVRDATLVGSSSDPRQVGDEAVLIARRARCPVAVGADRASAARLLVAAGCQLVLSDDGLQHLALRRDLEIVVVDGARGFGNGALLPQGPLRESVARLASVDAVVLNGTGAALPGHVHRPVAMSIGVEALRMVADDEAIPLDSLRGAPVHAVAGTGNPARFFAQLRALGCHPVEHAFADHHRFQPRDLAFAGAHQIVMTEKDAVKCRAFATGRMLYLQATAVLPEEGATRLLQLVQACLKKGALRA